MKKRVIILHGWDGHPENGWFPWLKQKLEKSNYQVIVPQLPNTANPRIENWIPAIQELVGIADNNTFFVGHSMGCQAIARYLETLPKDVVVGGAVFVAGFFTALTNLDQPEEVAETVRHWLDTPIDFKKIKSHLPKSTAVFSNDDPWVPLSNQEAFSKDLAAEIIIIKNVGHFSGNRDGTLELPIVLEILEHFNPTD